MHACILLCIQAYMYIHFSYIIYLYNVYVRKYVEINKNLKFKKGVGITIKSKETSSKLAI